jgi:hypothetical protein
MNASRDDESLFSGLQNEAPPAEGLGSADQRAFVRYFSVKPHFVDVVFSSFFFADRRPVMKYKQPRMTNQIPPTHGVACMKPEVAEGIDRLGTFILNPNSSNGLSEM